MLDLGNSSTHLNTFMRNPHELLAQQGKDYALESPHLTKTSRGTHHISKSMKSHLQTKTNQSQSPITIETKRLCRGILVRILPTSNLRVPFMALRRDGIFQLLFGCLQQLEILLLESIPLQNNSYCKVLSCIEANICHL